MVQATHKAYVIELLRYDGTPYKRRRFYRISGPRDGVGLTKATKYEAGDTNVVKAARYFRSIHRPVKIHSVTITMDTLPTEL